MSVEFERGSFRFLDKVDELLLGAELGSGTLPEAKGGLEMIIGDSHGIKDFSINGFVLQVNHVHLLPDALQSCLCAQGSQVCTHIAMCVLRHSSDQL